MFRMMTISSLFYSKISFSLVELHQFMAFTLIYNRFHTHFSLIEFFFLIIFELIFIFSSLCNHSVQTRKLKLLLKFVLSLFPYLSFFSHIFQKNDRALNTWMGGQIVSQFESFPQMMIKFFFFFFLVVEITF